MATKKTAAGAEATDEGALNEPALSYEEAREELMQVVRTLEQGGTTLEESLALWERGEMLAGVCQRFLDGARSRLDAAIGDNPER